MLERQRCKKHGIFLDLIGKRFACIMCFREAKEGKKYPKVKLPENFVGRLPDL